MMTDEDFEIFFQIGLREYERRNPEGEEGNWVDKNSVTPEFYLEMVELGQEVFLKESQGAI